MAKATWRGAVLAESRECRLVEGNHYFPPGALRQGYFVPSGTHTRCGWKGTASYYDIVVDGHRNRDAAWCYPEPEPAAEEIRGYVAFWRGVTVDP